MAYHANGRLHIQVGITSRYPDIFTHNPHTTDHNRRTRVPLVCKAWRDLTHDASLWSGTLNVAFPTRSTPSPDDPKQFYVTFAASVTAWMARMHAHPTAVVVTHSGGPDREGTALLQLLWHCLRWNVLSVDLRGFSAVTVSSALRVLGKQQRLIGLTALRVGVLDTRHEHRFTAALASYCSSLTDVRLNVCELVDGHDLLAGLSALTALTRLDVRVAGDAHHVLDQGVQVADMAWLRCLTALRHVELQGVPLPCLPSALTGLQQLTTIRLLHTAACFEDLPLASPCSNSVSSSWSTLQELDLSGGLTHEVVPAMVPASLTALRLRCVMLSDHDTVLFQDLWRPCTLPRRMPTGLRVLDLCCVGQVHGLSDTVLQTIAACTALTWLDLRRCRLATLPGAFAKLQSLRYVHCGLR